MVWHYFWPLLSESKEAGKNARPPEGASRRQQGFSTVPSH